jgi:hypothetical protein
VTRSRFSFGLHDPVIWALIIFAVAILERVFMIHLHGLWTDEFFSLAMATGHSLEHPASVADPSQGDYIEPPAPLLPSQWRRLMEHDSPPASVGRVIRAVKLFDTNPPLYYVGLWAWTRIFGTSDTRCARSRSFSSFHASRWSGRSLNRSGARTRRYRHLRCSPSFRLVSTTLLKAACTRCCG